MGQFEDALATLEADVASAQSSVDLLAKSLRQVLTAVRAGNIQQIEKGLSQLPALGQQAGDASADLSQQWRFDAKAYLESGYLDELREEASAAGLTLFERDGRVYAFPLLLRLLPADAAVRIADSTERAIRPKTVVRKLKWLQDRPQRLSEQRLLDLLYRAYQRLAGNEWRLVEQGVGPVVLLSDIHDLITLLPGSDYSHEEFGRDLLLLDRKPTLRARDGTSFRLVGSTLGRSAKKITVYDESGNAREFIAVSFVKEG